jgi:thioredoxin reductase (NADPH)
MLVETFDLLVIGAGPCGLAVGVAAKRARLRCVLLDRLNIVSTIERYPLGMTFFSTPERIEIGEVPFISSHEKPTRRDGLIYYRRVAEFYALDVRPSEEVVDVVQEPDGAFRVAVRRPHDEVTYRSDAVVFATGYYDNPNYLGVPGEDLPHVVHYFSEATPTGVGGWWSSGRGTAAWTPRSNAGVRARSSPWCTSAKASTAR